MMSSELDPIKYEVFIRGLKTVLEEGREAVFRISASAVIVEGGECMTSFYDGDGKPILTAQGTYFHIAGAGDSIKHAIKEYEENPGINDGDQFFYNDPYIAGIHLMDEIVVKPIFYDGRRVAWVGTMTHTSDVGGVLRGNSAEIFHEGLKIRGLKICEGDKIRKDILSSISDQCRDPHYVDLDIVARIASNNVITSGYMRLIENFGFEFVEVASRRLREDSEKLFRERLRSLPDGTWRERVYVSRTRHVGKKEEVVPLKIACTMTKEGDKLSLDFTGTSSQSEDYFNCTVYGARSCILAGLATTVLWDIPLNAGMVDLIDYTLPEGSIVNCRYPASCGLAPIPGLTIVTAIAGCIERMKYAGGVYEYVNSCWAAIASPSNFGPGIWFGGHSQHGGVVPMGSYDMFAGGTGATPYRDGVNTGGNVLHSRAAISDIEFVETYFPFLFLLRKQGTDSGGYGKFQGGMTLQNIEMVYGTKDLTIDFLFGPEGGEIRGFGLFGGYPAGNIIQDSIVWIPHEDITHMFSRGRYPISHEEMETLAMNAKRDNEFNFERQLGGIRIAAPEYTLISRAFGCGGGYGDPLDRDPWRVRQDLEKEAVSLEIAAKIYGVIMNPETLEIDLGKTEARRHEMKQERLSKGEKLTPEKGITKVKSSEKKRTLIRIGEYLEIVEKFDNTKVICCVKCGNEFCTPGKNYKDYALRWTRDIREIKKVAEGEQPLEYYQEYICPGCGTLLQVDTWCPLIDNDTPVWDIDIKV